MENRFPKQEQTDFETSSEALIRETKSEEGPHPDFLNWGRCPGGGSQLATPLGTFLKIIFKSKRTTIWFSK